MNLITQKTFDQIIIIKIINNIEELIEKLLKSDYNILYCYYKINSEQELDFKPNYILIIINTIKSNIGKSDLYDNSDINKIITMYNFILYNYYTIINLKYFYEYYNKIYKFYLNEDNKKDFIINGTINVNEQVKLLNNKFNNKKFKEFTFNDIEFLFDKYINFGIYHKQLGNGSIFYKGDNDYIYHNPPEIFNSCNSDDIYVSLQYTEALDYGINKVFKTGCSKNINILNFNLGNNIQKYKDTYAKLVLDKFNFEKLDNIIINIDGDCTEIIFKNMSNTIELYLLSIDNSNDSNLCSVLRCETEKEANKINFKKIDDNYKVIECGTDIFKEMSIKDYEYMIKKNQYKIDQIQNKEKIINKYLTGLNLEKYKEITKIKKDLYKEIITINKNIIHHNHINNFFNKQHKNKLFHICKKNNKKIKSLEKELEQKLILYEKLINMINTIDDLILNIKKREDILLSSEFLPSNTKFKDLTAGSYKHIYSKYIKYKIKYLLK